MSGSRGAPASGEMGQRFPPISPPPAPLHSHAAFLQQACALQPADLFLCRCRELRDGRSRSAPLSVPPSLPPSSTQHGASGSRPSAHVRNPHLTRPRVSAQLREAEGCRGHSRASMLASLTPSSVPSGAATGHTGSARDSAPAAAPREPAHLGTRRPPAGMWGSPPPSAPPPPAPGTPA